MTLAGANADIIGPALESVEEFVDLFVVLDTAGDRATIEMAKAVGGDRVIVSPYPWHDDFAAARNHALHVAQVAGATWAMPLDTDERIETNGEDIRATLSYAETEGQGALMMQAAAGYYTQCRAMRLPCSERYVGETH